jgi:hypothetical protein
MEDCGPLGGVIEGAQTHHDRMATVWNAMSFFSNYCRSEALVFEAAGRGNFAQPMPATIGNHGI